ncbi:RDD family protein [Oceanobacillus alkalisoli]|uniref:RDD family protein n=1 Tax=Oceanobacillus alkalisoli TaxID=2925113 RepID=UPI0034E2EF8F
MWIRFLASLIDGVLTGILTWIIATLINDERYFNTFDIFSDELYGLSTSETISNLIYTVIFVIIFTASKFKGSPGKMICRIEVVNPDMTQISFWKSLGRVFAYIVSAIPIMIGYMMAGWNKEKRALHDIICSTRVVYRNKLE